MERLTRCPKRFSIRKKPSSAPHPPLPDSHCIETYEGKPCLEWTSHNLVDVLFYSMSAVETNQDSYFLWIRTDPTSRWYDALNVVVQSLVMEIVRLIVNGEADAATVPKDESDTAPTSRIPPHRPHVVRILRRYLTFDLDDSSVGPLVRNEVVVLKEYHTSLESIKEPIQQITGETSQREIEEDILAVHVRESEEMDAASLCYTYQVKEEEANRLAKLKRENGRRIVNIQNDYGVKYAKDQDFEWLLEPALAPEQQDKLAHASRRLGVLGRSIQLRKDMEREHARIQKLFISAHQYENELGRELEDLDDQLVAVESTQATYQAQHEKHMAKEAHGKESTVCTKESYAACTYDHWIHGSPIDNTDGIVFFRYHVVESSG